MPIENIDQRIEHLRAVVDSGQRAAAEMAELQELKRLMEKYAGKVMNIMNAASVVGRVSERITNAAAIAAAITTKDRIILGAEAILQDGRRRRPKQLLEEMAKIGVTVPGKNPAAGLSSYLSKEKDRFETDPGSGGWTLTRLTKKANPHDAPTPQGFMFPTNGA
jgi:hypothetical protein